MVIVYYIVSRMLKQNIFRTDWWIVSWRGIFGVSAFLCFTSAVEFATAAKVNLLFNLNPLVILLLAYYFLKERISKYEYACCFIAYAGVAIMCFTRFNDSDNSGTIVTLETAEGPADGLDVSITTQTPINAYPNETKGLILALISGLCAGTAYTIVRKMNQSMHYIQSAFYNGFAGLPVIVIMFILKPSQFTIGSYSWGSIGYMMLVALIDLLGQLCMSLGYRYEDASRIGPINYFMIVISFGFQFLTHTTFNMVELIGVIIICIAVISPIFLRVGGYIVDSK